MEKKFTFVLDLDNGQFIAEEVAHSFKAIRNSANPRRWFVEELDTPFLSADSTYKVISGGKEDVIATSLTFLEWCIEAIS